MKYEMKNKCRKTCKMNRNLLINSVNEILVSIEEKLAEWKSNIEKTETTIEI